MPVTNRFDPGLRADSSSCLSAAEPLRRRELTVMDCRELDNGTRIAAGRARWVRHYGHGHHHHRRGRHGVSDFCHDRSFCFHLLARRKSQCANPHSDKSGPTVVATRLAFVFHPEKRFDYGKPGPFISLSMRQRDPKAPGGFSTPNGTANQWNKQHCRNYRGEGFFWVKFGVSKGSAREIQR